MGERDQIEKDVSVIRGGVFLPKKSTLIIDGKPYQGPNINEGFAEVKYIVPASNNQMLGFSDEKALFAWADKKGERKQYEDVLKSTEKTKKEASQLSDKEINDYEKKLEDEIKTNTAKFNAVLKKEGVASHEARKILKLTKEGKLGTLYLYEHVNYRGRRLSISNFSWISKLHRYNFNDITSSVINSSPFLVILWQNSYFWGLAVIVPPYVAFNRLGWFNDRTSSVSW
jgi:hypothetical protein